MIEPYYEEPNITIYCGDCLEIMKVIPDKLIDLVLTDPPYGMGQNIVNVGNCPAYKNSYAWNNNPPKNEIFIEIFRISKNQIIFGGNYFPILWSKPCKGFIFWDKIQCSNKHADGELVWTSFNKNAKQYRYCFSGNRYGWENHIQGVGKPSNRVHPTQKPTELISKIIVDYSNQSDTILDPFLGSGTTLVACKELNRKVTGIEISQEYCDIAIRRLKNTTPSLLQGVINVPLL